MKRVMPWIVGYFVNLLRWTVRIRFHNDVRDTLRAQGTPYTYVGLHAQQVAAVVSSERGTGALVSRSVDGDLLVRALINAKCVPIRGSGGRASKGGAAALKGLIDHVKNGRPTFIAVDGPKGPRGKVHPGAAMLSQKTGAAVLAGIAIPSRRTILKKTWDRLQIPWPFCRLDVTFCDPYFPQDGESPQDFALRIEQGLNELERRLDPEEAAPDESNEPVAVRRAA